MSEYKIVSAAEAQALGKGTRKSPAQMIIESLPEGSMTYKELAARYGCHQETLRRLCKAVDKDGNPKVKAPSEAAVNGGMVVYSFTPEDVQELDAYFSKKGRRINA